MLRARRTVFLERGTYRRRRMIDALRLVAVLGVILWFIPVLWPDGTDEAAAIPMSRALAYVFGAWLVLIGFALVLARLMRGEPAADSAGSAPPEAEG